MLEFNMPKLANTLTLSEINNIFYEKNNQLYWKINKGNRKRDSLAGSITKEGYSCVLINRVKFRIHRILYQIYNGVEELDPTIQIDHIDCNFSNNSKDNLRLASHCQNSMNRGVFINNTSGHKNIIIDKQQYKKSIYYCYRVIIKANMKTHSKRFPYNIEGLSSAISYRNDKISELHGTFANINNKENPNEETPLGF
jgi:hypothetical protein